MKKLPVAKEEKVESTEGPPIVSTLVGLVLSIIIFIFMY